MYEGIFGLTLLETLVLTITYSLSFVLLAYESCNSGL